MFCLFDRIYICSIEELENLNISNFSYIINCSIQLNNILTYQNVINTNFDKPIYFIINNIIQLLEYIYNCYISGLKIILVDETGIDNSMFITIMFLMKYHKKNYDTIYSTITFYKNIHPKEYYISISSIEYYLLHNISNITSEQNLQNSFNQQNNIFNLQYKNNI
jgi:hypothetical protein